MSGFCKNIAFENVVVCNHPLAEHNITILRDKNTPAELFRLATKRLASLLIVEATKNIPLESKTINTPLQQTEGKILSNSCNIILAPILRAALILSREFEDILPTARVHHLGLYRNEETLEPISYYNKIPPVLEDPDKTIVYVLDPMFATGGSAVAGVKVFIDLGVKEENITFVSLISAPEGIKNFRNHYKTVKVITAVIDEKLNNKGYIMPGLGDAGDRTFNTVY